MVHGDKNRKIECPGCGGSGQISYFKGVSRFLVSTEECPECAGMGFVLKETETAETASGARKADNK